MALVALTYNEFECLKYLTYESSLVYKGSIEWRSSLRKSRKCLSLVSNT